MEVVINVKKIYFQLTPSGIGTSNVVPEGACMANSVLSLKHLHISSCLTYADVLEYG